MCTSPLSWHPTWQFEVWKPSRASLADCFRRDSMLPLPLSPRLLLLCIYITLFALACFDLVVLVVNRPAAVMFQVRPGSTWKSTRAPQGCECDAPCPILTSPLLSASATPSTLASQRNRHVKSLHKITFPDRIQLAVRAIALLLPDNVPAPDATRAPLFADPIPKNSRRSLRSGMMRTRVARPRLA